MKQKSNEMKANQFKCVIRKQGVNGAKSETKKKKILLQNVLIYNHDSYALKKENDEFPLPF